MVTTPLTLGQSVDPTLAKSYQDRLKTAESDIRIFIDRDATERHEALNRFRDMARNIESTAEADHDAGRIPEGGYLAIMERLNTMFRRVPADA